MDTKTLKKANELNKKISEFNEALNCFEYSPDEDGKIKYSTHPEVIIEFDGADGREQIKLPMILSNAFTRVMKEAIIEGLKKVEMEFHQL